MRVLVAAGGTGGHLYPALALANYLKKEHLAQEIIWIGGKRFLEKEIVTSSGFKFLEINTRSCPRGFSWKWPFFLWNLTISLKQCFFIFLKSRPQVVVGMGSFHSYPVIIISFLLGIPSLICEQNLIPSLTNRTLARRATAIAISFPQTKEYFAPLLYPKIKTVGNPVRKEILTTKRKEASIELNMKENRFTLLFLGGSQGADFLNQIGIKVLQLLDREEISPQIQSIFIVGIQNKELALHPPLLQRIKLLILPYSSKIQYVYAMSDLVISRSGATTLAEITACGLPSILIPYPYATENHQWRNAQILERKGAALLVAESELKAKRLKKLILDLINNREILREMSKKSRQLGKRDSTEQMAKLLISLRKN